MFKVALHFKLSRFTRMKNRITWVFLKWVTLLKCRHMDCKQQNFHSLESMFVKQLGHTQLSSILSIERTTVLFMAQVERDNELLSVVSLQTRNLLDHQSLHGDYVWCKVLAGRQGEKSGQKSSIYPQMFTRCFWSGWELEFPHLEFSQRKLWLLIWAAQNSPFPNQTE